MNVTASTKTVTASNKILDNRIAGAKLVKVNKVFIEVKTALTTDEFIAFVNTVTDLSFDENGEYNGAFERIAIRYAVVKFLTNVEIEGLSVNNVFDCTFQDWFKPVMNAVKKTSYWDELKGAVRDNIAHRKEISLKNRKNSFDKLCDALTEIIANFSEFNASEAIENLGKIAEKISTSDNAELVNAIAAHAKKNG